MVSSFPGSCAVEFRNQIPDGQWLRCHIDLLGRVVALGFECFEPSAAVGGFEPSDREHLGGGHRHCRPGRVFQSGCFTTVRYQSDHDDDCCCHGDVTQPSSVGTAGRSLSMQVGQTVHNRAVCLSVDLNVQFRVL